MHNLEKKGLFTKFVAKHDQLKTNKRCLLNIVLLCDEKSLIERVNSNMCTCAATM